MTKIDDQELIYSETLLILDEKTAHIELVVSGWTFRMRLTFHPTGEGERTVRTEVAADHVHLHFDKWNEAIGGTALTAPYEVAKLSSGSTINMLLFHEKVGGLNSIHVQLTRGGQNG
jgi:hypothetical protein